MEGTTKARSVGSMVALGACVAVLLGGGRLPGVQAQVRGGASSNSLEARVSALEAKLAQLQTANAALQADNAALKAKTASLSAGTDGQGKEALYITGVNVYIQDGSGKTGNP